MDTRIRDLERRARSGDLEAARAWFIETGRTGDLQATYDAMMFMVELEQPGLLKQLREIQEIMEISDQVRRLTDNVSWPASGPTPYIWATNHTSSPAMT